MRSKDLGTWERRNMSMATQCVQPIYTCLQEGMPLTGCLYFFSCIAQEECLKYRRACTAKDTSYESCCGVPPDCSPASGE